MAELSSHLDVLSAQAHAEGGWGYAPDQPAHLEPTCLALLALNLQADRYQTVLTAAKAALDRCRTADGTYRLGRGRPEAVWPTALVLFVQAALHHPREETSRTAARLLGLRGQVPPGTKSPDMIDIDFSLVGWPWAENNFSWAEPT